MLKNCDNSNLVISEIKCTVAKHHKIENKPQDLLVNTTSSGNRVLHIAGCTDPCRNSTHNNMTRISQMMEQHLCTH